MRTNVSLSEVNTYTDQLVKKMGNVNGSGITYMFACLRIKHTWDISRSLWKQNECGAIPYVWNICLLYISLISV